MRRAKLIFGAIAIAGAIIALASLCASTSTVSAPSDGSGKTVAVAPVREGISLGLRAPDFTLRDLSGASVHLADLRGKPVFINFWATWCPPCRMEMPEMQRFWADHRQDVQIVAVNLTFEEDSPKDVGPFLKARGFTFPVVLDLDSTVAERYVVRGVPTSFFLDRQGIVRATALGPMDRATMEANFRKAQAGQ